MNQAAAATGNYRQDAPQPPHKNRWGSRPRGPVRGRKHPWPLGFCRFGRGPIPGLCLATRALWLDTLTCLMAQAPVQPRSSARAAISGISLLMLVAIAVQASAGVLTPAV